MAYDPTKDFVGLWRNTAGSLSKIEMPGLDFVVAALARAGLVSVSVSATQPLANQATTAWYAPAVPSTSAEGALYLWNAATSAYQAATPALFAAFLLASNSDNGVSWYTSAGGPPLNTVGSNGDFAIRTDQPGGIYGPKALGAWPADPLPGTTTAFTSAELDVAFGDVTGALIYRGASLWQTLAVGPDGSVMTSAGGLPTWDDLSGLLDIVFSNVRGSVLYRGAAVWAALPPGVSGQGLRSGGPAADPSWGYEFPPGTVMLFNQTAAPTGWTKLTDLDDVGLRVVSGAVTGQTGTAFSTVFTQTQVGGHTLTVSEIPAHTHKYNSYGIGPQQTNNVGPGYFPNASNSPSQIDTDSGTGGGAAHTHTVSLNLSYTDVIRASKN